LVVFVIPSLEVLFEGRDVNRFTSFVVGVSHFFTRRWAIYLPLLGSLSAGGIYLYSSAWGKRALHRLSLFLPLSKTLVIHSAIARFARTMGSLLQGGVPILQALQIARKVLQNPFLEEVIEEAEARITEGSLLSQELKKSSLIPKLVPRLLAIGEEAGNAAGMLHKIADFYEDELDKTLSRITTLAQPVVLVIMGGLVGLIMLAILLPLTDINAFL
jgi:general secretion pathway protein F/type IV pilus assembly protein PilC